MAAQPPWPAQVTGRAGGGVRAWIRRAARQRRRQGGGAGRCRSSTSPQRRSRVSEARRKPRKERRTAKKFRTAAKFSDARRGVAILMRMSRVTGLRTAGSGASLPAAFIACSTGVVETGLKGR